MTSSLFAPIFSSIQSTQADTISYVEQKYLKYRPYSF